MLVEINLLPQKEPKKFNIFYLSGIVAILVLIGGLYFWQIQSAKNDIASLEQQIAMTKKIATKQQENAKMTEVTTSASLLKVAVDWANSYPIDTIPVMRHLTSLLPDRGFIQTFAYSEAGTVTLSVQFDNAREAAYFLESLKDSDWITDATLNSLTISETKETTKATAQTAAQNPAASTTNNASGQNTGSAATTSTNQQSTPNTATTNQNSSSVQQNNPNNTASTTTNQATVTNSNTTGTVATTPAITPDKNILPRYIGQFEIKFNLEAIKKSTKKSKKEEKGVTGS
jgi:Tfp pilus assembly protein PilN